MLGLSTLLLHPSIPIQIQQFSKSLSFSPLNNQISPSSSILTLTKNPKIPKRFAIRAENNADYDGGGGDYNNNGGGGGGGGGDAGGGGAGDLKKDRRIVFNLKSGDLLEPEPDNGVAVALTGSLSWASVQFLEQLYIISSAILLCVVKSCFVDAVKYSFMAASFIFIFFDSRKAARFRDDL